MPNSPIVAAPRKLLAHERHAFILRSLRTSGSVQVPAVAAALGVSEMTVRRDLLELEQDSKLVRIHGGAVASDEPSITMDSDEPSFDVRLGFQSVAKDAIAMSAAELLAGCRTIAVDIGTTTYRLAQRMLGYPHLKLFTNSLRVAELVAGQGPEIYLAGGKVRADERSVHGPSAVAQFEQLWFDASVIGVAGLTADGFYDYAFEEVDMKRVFMRRSGIKMVLCDASKFRRMSLVHVGSLNSATTLVTDAEPPPEIRVALDAAHVEVHVVTTAPSNA